MKLYFICQTLFPQTETKKNETFKPFVNGARVYLFQIFNRWGERLFVTDDPQSGWDGTFQSQPCKEDIYVWKVTLSTIKGEQKNQTGSVMLIR